MPKIAVIGGTIDYTPESGSFPLHTAAHFLACALTDYDEFPDEEEEALTARLAPLIEAVTDTATWEERGAVVTVTRDNR